MDEHTKSIHYLLMADHFMVQKALLNALARRAFVISGILRSIAARRIL